MFCYKCGVELVDDTKFCGKCGASISSNDSQSIQHFSEVTKKAGIDAYETLKMLASNPVGKLSAAFENLKHEQVLSVSIIFIIASAILSAFGIKSLIQEYLGIFYSPDFFPLLISSLLFPASIFIVIFFVSTIIKQKYDYLGALFIASVFNIPISIFFLIVALLSLSNMEVLFALIVFILSFSILILFTGCVNIIKLTEQTSSLAVPIILLISLWLTTILLRAILL